MPNPLCFILMPFGKKPNPDKSMVDFDAIYSQLIAPAVEAADLEPLRADQETTSGIIHKPMFERLVLCRFAVVDLTQFNPNVFYELGVRHAARPSSTVQIIAAGARLPFDIQMLRTIHYKLGPAGEPDVAELPKVQMALTTFLKEARAEAADSPIFQLLDGFQPATIDHSKTDLFRTAVEYSNKIKDRLAVARKQSVKEVLAVEASLKSIENEEAGVLIDLLLSYRDCKAWDEMIRLYDTLPQHLRRTILVREQYALALNRAGQRDWAERVLLELIKERGPSSETYGILGRVYKDHWEDAGKAGRTIMAEGLLDQAIDAYTRGFEADWRDAYPGVNAATLMTIHEPPDARAEQLLPLVRYAAERKIAAGQPDYWDYATLVEVGVLGKDRALSLQQLGKALATHPAAWMTETTVRNLRLIREARERRKEAPLGWDAEIEKELMNAAAN
jgi:tetratricopeptide (TPR) repeat protein